MRQPKRAPRTAPTRLTLQLSQRICVHHFQLFLLFWLEADKADVRGCVIARAKGAPKLRSPKQIDASERR